MKPFKIFIFPLVCLCISFLFNISFAQVSSGPDTLQSQAESIHQRLDSLYKETKKKKGKENRIRAKKLKT